MKTVKVRGENYIVIDTKSISHLGSKFFGKVCHTLEAEDGTKYQTIGKVGKLPAHNARLTHLDEPQEAE